MRHHARRGRGGGSPAGEPARPRAAGVRAAFARAACAAAQATGTFWAFGAALGTIVLWAALGPAFRFSDSWQLVINTGTTIITFLMVFLIQHAQNRDVKALHLKLNELVAGVKDASDRLVDVEDLSEEELDALERRYRAFARRVRREGLRAAAHGTGRRLARLAAAPPPARGGALTPTRPRARTRRSPGSGTASR